MESNWVKEGVCSSPIVVTGVPYTEATIYVGIGSTLPSQVTPTLPVSDPDSVGISLSIYNNPPDPISLSMKQNLIVVPPPGWGDLGWDISFDSTYFQLDPRNEPKWPSPGWWKWLPLKPGQNKITIKAVPPPCANIDPKCSFPEFSVILNVQVSP